MSKPILPASRRTQNPLVGFGGQFEDMEESRYFRLFCDETSLQLSGGFDTSFWSRLILQASHDEPCIKHAVIATAALSVVMKVQAYDERLIVSHRHFAFQQYGKALSGLRSILSRGENQIRIALISSLLIFTFETFYGDHKSARANVEAGIHMMHQWMKDNFLERSYWGISSPKPRIVEDQIVHAFARLDLNVASWINTPLQRVEEVNRQRPSLPTVFKDLEDARIYWQHLIRKLLNLKASIVQEILKKSADEESVAGKKNIDSKPAGLMDGFNTKEHSESLVKEQIELINDHAEWCTAFEAIYHQARESIDDFIPATILRLHAILGSLSLITGFYISPQNDDLQLEYAKILILSKDIIEHPRFARTFTIDVGILPGLFVVATKGKAIVLRKQAIDLLFHAAPRREGLWDALVAAKLALHILKIEEAAARTIQSYPEFAEVREAKEFGTEGEQNYGACIFIKPVFSDVLDTTGDPHGNMVREIP
jgi:hypothetical protein